MTSLERMSCSVEHDICFVLLRGYIILFDNEIRRFPVKRLKTFVATAKRVLR